MSDQTREGKGGLFSTIARILRTLREVAANRIELFLVEWQEERLRLFDMLLLALAGAICALMALILVTFTLVVVFWNTHRVLVLVLMALAYAIIAAVAVGTLRSKLRRWQAFSATIEQIKKDRACLEERN